MAFSKREKLIIGATIFALVVVALDFYVLTPLLDAREDLAARKTRLSAKMSQAGSLLQRGRLLGRKWRAMVDDGMKDGPAEAESQALRALGDWCDESRLVLKSLRAERSSGTPGLPEVNIDLTGTGSMDAVRGVLWRIRTAKIPMKIRMLQLGGGKDEPGNLSLQLKVSTLYAPARPASPDDTPGRPKPAGDSR